MKGKLLKILAVLACLTLSAGFVACGGSGGDKGENSGGSSGSSVLHENSSSEVSSFVEESSSEVIEDVSSEEESGETSENSTPVEDESSEDGSEDRSEDSSDVHEHDYELTDSKAATCTENGYETYVCGACGDAYTQTVLGYGGHDLITVVEKEATCTENGKIVTTCQREFCDYEKVTITYGSHNYYIKETQEATCTTDGYVLYHCDNCGDEYTLTTDASHNYVAGETVEPTCADKGYTEYICTKCGNVIHSDYVDVTGEHNWVESEKVAPTCTEGGYTVYSCTECGAETVSDISACTGHNYVFDAVAYRPIKDENDVIIGAVVEMKCAACGDIEYVEATKNVDIKKPTCKDKGTVTTTYTYEFNGETYTLDDITEIVEIDDTGKHTFITDGMEEALEAELGAQIDNKGDVTAKLKALLDANVLRVIGGASLDCTRYTSVVGRCAVCENLIRFDISGEHKYSEDNRQNEGSCTKDAYTPCSNCDKEEAWIDIVKATGHVYEYVEGSYADGKVSVKCTKCGHIETNVAVEYFEEVPATCQADGYVTYAYEYVDPDGITQQGVYTEILSQTEHNYNGYEFSSDTTIVYEWDELLAVFDTVENGGNGDGEITEDEGLQLPINGPSCAQSGLATFNCTDCGSFIALTIMGDHNWDAIEIVPPTCMEDGYTVYGCTECGAEKDSETLPATGIHSYNGYEFVVSGFYTWDYILQTFGEDLEGFRWISGDAPTCEEAAVAIFDCEACDNPLAITVEGPHEYMDGSCTYCGEADPNAPVIDEETIVFLEDGTVNFGKYPQAKVTDSATTSALTTKAGSLPTVNAGGWTSYGYYILGSNTTDYMWYQDVEYGDSKYRGVYFSSYRPHWTTDSSSTSNTYQDDNGYTTSTLYWFEYEWINWTILEETDGEYFLLCNSIIDSQEYYHTTGSRTIDGQTVYANNYAESNIRKWLNETFYETAFDELQQSLIQTTLVDNSAKSTNPYGQETYWNNGVNNYACENTNDKIFLLSEEEVTNSNYGFDSNPGAYGVDNARIRQPSDYAQSQGAWTYSGGSYDGNGYWWLRSPSYGRDYNALLVDVDGYANYYYYVRNASDGVVPALKIQLS